MKPAPFKYVAAESSDHAVGLLGDLGDQAKVLAGGQSLLAFMNFRMATPDVLIDIGRCGLAGISANGQLRIGATTTQSAALQSPAVRESAPLLARALGDVGHYALRNRGTIGGSVAHADPAAEIPAVLVALGGSVEVRGPTGDRTIAADDLFVSHYTTALAQDELLTVVRLPSRPPDAWAFYEIARRRGDFALAGVSAAFGLSGAGEIVDARVVLFGVDRRPVRATQAEGALLGRRLDDAAAVREAGQAAAAAVEPPGDLHGSTKYRKRLTDVAVRRALSSATIERSAG
jgi:carbon-monoxide dehydrogenase medium subunit